MLGEKLIRARKIGAIRSTKGKRTPGTPGAPFYFKGSVQPLSGFSINTFPDTVRESAKYRLFTKIEFNPYDKAEPHQIEYEGVWFDIHAAKVWRDGITHNEYILFKVKEGA